MFFPYAIGTITTTSSSCGSWAVYICNTRQASCLILNTMKFFINLRRNKCLSKFLNSKQNLKFVKFKGKFTIRRKSYILSKYGQLVATCKLENDLYKLGISNETNKVLTNVTSSSSSANLRHERLGHINQKHLQTMVHKNIAIRLDLVEVNSSHFCQSCNARKQYRELFLQEGATRASVLLELVHSNICGLIQSTTHIGFK